MENIYVKNQYGRIVGVNTMARAKELCEKEGATMSSLEEYLEYDKAHKEDNKAKDDYQIIPPKISETQELKATVNKTKKATKWKKTDKK